MDFKDYYKIMGVDRKSTQDEIKRAYRKLARKYHPDVSKEPDAEARFKELGEAYEVLKDPEKRVAYDQLGANWKAGQDFRPPPDWDAGFEFHGAGGGESDPGVYSDFFESLFGHGFRSSRASAGQSGFKMRGEDHHAKVLIDLEDSFSSASRHISLRVPVVDDYGQVTVKDRNLSVKIPKGVIAGQKIRLSSQGGPGIGGERAGDLYLEVQFKPHPFYQVDGKDISLDLPVAPWEAALGATVKVPTPEGAVDLKIPENSGNRSRLRLKGRGIPSAKPGDMYVRLNVVLPPASTENARDLYRQMQREMSFNPRSNMGV